MRLRRWDPAGPAILRRRRGRGFGYVDVDGAALRDEETLSRIAGLVIPPAWADVRICPWPHGHLQAVGTDDAGRRQYLYHDAWREQRDRQKFERVREFGQTLPKARARIADDLATRGLNRRRVLAAAARLLDIGFFRIGGETYAQENGSHGLATVLRSHASIARGSVVFEYPAKSGQERVQAVADDQVVAVVRALMRRREPDQTLLAYYEGRAWHEVRSADVNDYLHDICGDDNSAKDFRTWHGTVLAAVALATATDDDPAALSPTARRRAETRAIKEVAEYLGNTPAVARSAYVDPAVIEAFEHGLTIRPALERLGTDEVLVGEQDRDRIERAVLDLLDEIG